MCPENVFLCDGRLTVIDWENAGPAATVQDLGSTLWDFCQGDIGRTRAFVDHYRRHGGPIGRLEASVFDTARVVQANLVDFHCRRALDPTAHPRRTSGPNGALRAILARPLTRQLIDDLVAARSYVPAARSQAPLVPGQSARREGRLRRAATRRVTMSGSATDPSRH